MKDRLAVVMAVFVLAVVLLWPLVYLLAPCGWLDWLPIAQAPTRCIR